MERRDFLQLGFGIAVGAAGGFRWITSDSQVRLSDSDAPAALIPGLLLRIPTHGPEGTEGALVLELRHAGTALMTHEHRFVAGQTLEVPTPTPPLRAPYGLFEVWASLPVAEAAPRLLGGYAIRPLRFGC
ncbi:MAG: hypothetical protein H6747_02670 [Deltaproteobacteria bacterium]|nr:hypothetical protein [Deltaproteobacteria bacterium]